MRVDAGSCGQMRNGHAPCPDVVHVVQPWKPHAVDIHDFDLNGLDPNLSQGLLADLVSAEGHCDASGDWALGSFSDGWPAWAFDPRLYYAWQEWEGHLAWGNRCLDAQCCDGFWYQAEAECI